MTPSTLLLRSRGWAWQLSVSVLSVAGLAILSGMSGFGAQLVLGMTAEDAWLWSSSLGSLATSGILASLATSEAALYEVTRSRALWRQRSLLFLACLLFLGWPVLGVLLLSAVLFVRAGEGARGLPIMYTPLAYLQTLRLEQAKQLLETTRMSLDSITYKIGYEDSNSFRRLFLQRVGLLPAAYRKKFQAGGR